MNIQLAKQLPHYASLLRLNKPIGSFLLLWPTLTALWIANQGKPSWHLLLIFITGVFLMRAAGCVLNDLADRKFDGSVARTQQRPLATGKVSVLEALIIAGILLFLALGLVFQLNRYCLLLAFIGAALTALYPFAKRITHLPQLLLAVTFNLGILMAFAAVQNSLTPAAWLLYSIGCLWTIAYDTQYAMSDKEDDLKIGIKSTAILLGRFDQITIVSLQIIILFLLVFSGLLLNLNYYFYSALFLTGGFFIYQYHLISNRIPKNCFKAFVNNQWPLFFIFIAIFFNNFV